MDGLEHKDERLHVVEQPDWRDKLARLRDGLTGDDDTSGDEDGEEAGGASRSR